MNDITATTQRIVVVHGPMDHELFAALTQSGLEAIVDDGNVSIWSPRDRSSGEMPVAPATPVLVDVATAAAWLGVSQPSVCRLVDAGQVDVVHVDRSVLIPTEALEELVDGLRRRPKVPMRIESAPNCASNRPHAGEDR